MLSLCAACWAAGLLGHVQVSDVDCKVPECRLTVLRLLPRQSTLQKDMDTAGQSQDALGPSAM